MRRVGVLLVALLVLLLALTARLTHLDSGAGLSGASYDEAVWAWAARLFLHGVLPYRDYFFPQPPAAAFVFSPAMLLDSSAWGSPDSFLAARQLSVLYGLISVGLVFAIGHRLAGWWGATAAAVVWSLDPRVAGLSAQVLLDGPMILLSFAAILAYLAVHPALTPRVTLRHQMIGLERVTHPEQQPEQPSHPEGPKRAGHIAVWMWIPRAGSAASRELGASLERLSHSSQRSIPSPVRADTAM